MATSRRAVSVMDRMDLEERFFEIGEENQLLKKHAKAQEEKMKKLATKLLKLTSDERRELSVRKKGREELEDVVIELQDKVRELERHKANLMGKVTILRQQLESKTTRRHTPYDRVPPKVNSGLSKTRRKSFSSEDMSAMKRHSVSAQVSPGPVRYGHSLLEDARRDNQELEELVLVLKKEVGSLQEEVELCKEENKMANLRNEEALLHAKEQLQLAKTSNQKVLLDEDVEKIRLQRELRLKSVAMETIQSQITTLEKNLESVTIKRDKLLNEVTVLSSQLKQEHTHNVDLSNELHSAKISAQNIDELNQLIVELRMERDVLKQSNDRLLKSALSVPIPSTMFHSDQPQPSVILTNQLFEERNRDTEKQLQTLTDTHSNTLHKLHNETKLRESVCKELEETRAQLHTLKNEYQSMESRLSQYCQGSVDWNKIEDAFVKFNAKDNDVIRSSSQIQCAGQCQEEIQELSLALSDTRNELNKSNKLLTLQNKITQDYKRETEAIGNEMNRIREEHERKLHEMNELLDIKLTEIKKLEAQLDDINYKPQKINLEKPQILTESMVELDQHQSLLQVDVDQLTLSPSTLHTLSSPTPSVFICLSFPGHQTQVTPVEHSAQPMFGFTANYVVNSNEQLNRGTILVEVFEAFGMDYVLLGTVSLSLSSLLSNGSSSCNGKVTIRGDGKLSNKQQIGCLEYCLKIKQSTNNERSSNISRPLQTVGSDAHNNELIITILKCINLPLSNEGQPPLPYVMYQFYTYEDYDTPILRPTVSPEFNDAHAFGVRMGDSLNQCLIQNCLEVYVFDDATPIDSGYVGVARIPLHRLSNGENIKGTYPLHSAKGVAAGQVSLSIVWGEPFNKTVINDQHSTSPTLYNESFKNQSHITSHLQSPTEPHPPISEPSLSSSDKEPHPLSPLSSDNRNETMEREVNRNEDDIRNIHENIGNDISDTNEDITDVTDEDTLFEETATNVNTPDDSRPVMLLNQNDIDESVGGDSLDLSSEDNDDEVTPFKDEATPLVKDKVTPLLVDSKPIHVKGAESQQLANNFEVRFSLTILSFTVEEDNAVLSNINPPVTQIFVEYQLLDIDSSELETPVSQPLPPPGHAAVFNFTKEFPISSSKDPSTAQLLFAMLHSDSVLERRIPFTLVSDPHDSNGDTECVEIGIGELDLLELIEKCANDETVQDIDILNIENDTEVIGYLTVSLHGLKTLRDVI